MEKFLKNIYFYRIYYINDIKSPVFTLKAVLIEAFLMNFFKLSVFSMVS